MFRLLRRVLEALAIGLLCFGFLAATPALAQFIVAVSGVGLAVAPISLIAFRGQAVSGQPISDIVLADL